LDDHPFRLDGERRVFLLSVVIVARIDFDFYLRVEAGIYICEVEREGDNKRPKLLASVDDGP
jgi:hypothetical protein